jgi:hypothetical protein
MKLTTSNIKKIQSGKYLGYRTSWNKKATNSPEISESFLCCDKGGFYYCAGYPEHCGGTVTMDYDFTPSDFFANDWNFVKYVKPEDCLDPFCNQKEKYDKEKYSHCPRIGTSHTPSGHKQFMMDRYAKLSEEDKVEIRKLHSLGSRRFNDPFYT